MPRGTFPDCCCQCRPHSEALLTHTSTGDLPTLAGLLVQPPMGLLLFSSESWCLQGSVHTLQDKPLFAPGSPVLWKSCNQISMAFKVRFPGDSRCFLSDPQAGKPDMVFQTFPTVGELLCYYCSTDCSGYRIWFYHDCDPPAVSL